ncbi:hypothetical protein A2763_02050 [Candidatus Kaiserbacteria bacterium RIFCSPHIGHO2_01_FULL_54_36]|uniref:Polysaccharide biosynthesis protein C-terminal domain-containing protein n=1 Tax=Candidatus Kaiserbacteria bacterium RIFCSPHIGHO2_01_FULL_54_36 TaxID=1798482 RepID=A0A1F6CQ03_9BACT|nr:MAG: hypothetical protein A2763_02050 [Candidatus Kaiserbacteria bacterium RIFCSPHIGHO2_01_FULL_54_36]OGG75891.1 MAG: hypothetical protein A3A41_04520 [Candidatus Kaiserbacteria bacterium RIFCSPLOWO2_01_FULL_54_22]
MLTRIKLRVLDLLRWSEAYTRTDMVYATQGGFWLSLAKVVGLISSLLFAVAMANLVPPEVFGTYKFVISGAAIIGAFSLGGVGTAIIQAVARGYEGALHQGTKAYLRWSFGIIAIAIAIAIYYFLNGNEVLAISFLIAGACNPLIIGFSFFGQFISGKKDFRTFSIFDTLRNVAPAFVLIATVFFTSDPVLIILVFFVSCTVTNILLYYSTVQKYQPNELVDPQSIPYAKHLSLMGIMVKVAENIDKVLVFHYLGASQLAIYAFAQTPIGNLKLLNDIPARLALPKLSERSFPELKRSLPRKILLLAGIMAVIVVLYIAFAPLIFQLLFPAYLDSVIYTQVLALSLLFAPGTMFGEALTAHMKRRELYLSQAVLPIIKIALFLILLPLFGLWGAIGAIIASQFLTFVLYAFQFWRVRPI